MDEVRQALWLRPEELPRLPAGWRAMTTMDACVQLKPGKLFDSKTVKETGRVPVLNQSAGDFLGYHDESPGVEAGPGRPVVTFANHTCAMRLMTQPFSTIQNIFPKIGKPGVTDTVYFYYASLGRVGLADYKGHHPLFRRAYIPVPPLSVQTRIAGILSTYDKLIENGRLRIRILEEMARALYREWFVRFRFPGHEDHSRVRSPLGEIPDGWSVKNLFTLCDRIESGGTPKRQNAEYWVDGEISWFKTGELWDGFLFESAEKITDMGQRHSSARLFAPGTILMAIYGSPTVGRLGILTQPSSCNQAALGLVADNNKISQTFLYFVLLFLRDHFNALAQGAAQQNISKEKVANTAVLVPTRAIIATFDSIAEPMFAQLQTLQRQIQNLRRTRDLLLPRLMSGQPELDIA
jgi:type I restriction enzyme S subunit